jgi:hypothetical protein
MSSDAFISTAISSEAWHWLDHSPTGHMAVASLGHIIQDSRFSMSQLHKDPRGFSTAAAFGTLPNIWNSDVMSLAPSVLVGPQM